MYNHKQIVNGARMEERKQPQKEINRESGALRKVQGLVLFDTVISALMVTSV